jgi:hypothetical protein
LRTRGVFTPGNNGEMGEFRGERDGKGERGEGQKKGSKSKRK